MTKLTTEMWLPNPITLPDGHRLFCPTEYAINRSLPRALYAVKDDESHGMWAVADESGETPETTDDGILWLDFTSNIIIGPDASNPRIPVRNPQGDKHVIITNTAGLILLSDMFRWTINVGGKLYRTIRL